MTRTMEILSEIPQYSQGSSRHPKYSDWSFLKFNKNNFVPVHEPTISDTQKQNIEYLLDAVNNSSQHVRNFYITFLLTGVYIAIVIWSTTDVMLLKKTPVNLPLLNVELSITGFYTYAPYFYLLLFFNLLLQLSLLSNKLHMFDRAISKFPGNEFRISYYTRLFPFAFSHTLSGRQHTSFLRFLLSTMTWVTIVWFPLSLLLGLQIGFLAYHSEQVLDLQRCAIAINLVLLVVFLPIILAPDGKWFTWIKQATGFSTVMVLLRRQILKYIAIRHQGIFQTTPQHSSQTLFRRLMIGWGICLGSLVTSVAVVAFSWGVVVLPGSENEKWVAKWVLLTTHWLDDQTYEIVGQRDVNKNDESPTTQKNRQGWITIFLKYLSMDVNSWLSVQPLKRGGPHYFRLTELLFDRTYPRDSSGKIKKDSLGEIIYKNSIFHRNLQIREKLLLANEVKPEIEASLTSEDENIRDEALKKSVGLVLKGRDLRYADFTGSLMPKVDFREDNGIFTDLSNASFESAMLARAKISRAKLQGANLKYTHLQGANMKYVDLRNANLERAHLEKTILSSAKLQRANLKFAKLQEAIMININANGAYLAGAKLQTATLERAQLQGAFLNSANLNGAILKYADLRGASLANAKLQGANLQYTHLEATNLFNADFSCAYMQATQLQGAEITSATFQGANMAFANLKGVSMASKYPEIAIRAFDEYNGYAEIHSDIMIAHEIDLSNTTITGALFGNFKQPELDNFLSKIEEPKLREYLQKRLFYATKTSFPLHKAKGKNIWAGGKRDEIVRKAFDVSKGKLEFAKSESDYNNSLIQIKRYFACKDKYIAAGLISNPFFRVKKIPDHSEDNFHQSLLLLKDIKDKYDQPLCPGVSELSIDKLQKLKESAERVVKPN